MELCYSLKDDTIWFGWKVLLSKVNNARLISLTYEHVFPICCGDLWPLGID
jgi:hypothetical protein